MARVCQAVVWLTCGVLFLGLVGRAYSAGFVFLNPPFTFLSIPILENVPINCTTNGTNVTTSLLKQFSGSWVPLPHPKLGVKVLKQGDIFTVLQFDLSGSGRYKCSATDNTGKTIEWPGIGGLLVPNFNTLPEMSINPYLSVISVGESTNFTCKSSASITLTWYRMIDSKNDVAVPMDKITTINTLKSKLVILMINNAKRSDTGNYKCILTYNMKQDYELAALRVLEPMPPKIVSHTPSIDTRVSQDVYLECIVQGYPKPNIKWYKGEHEMKGCIFQNHISECYGSKYIIGNKVVKVYQEYNATLKISKVTYTRDHGMYYCKAEQSNVNAEAGIYVNVKVKPAIDKQRGTQIAWNNMPYKLACFVVKSNPSPTWTWVYQERICVEGGSCSVDPFNWKSLSKDHTIEPAISIPTNRSTINIPKNVLKNYYYRCTATNQIGSDNFTTALIRTDVNEIVKIVESKVPLKYTEGMQPIRIECDILEQFNIFGAVWYKDHKIISTFTDSRIIKSKVNSTNHIYDRFILTVMNTTVNDTGTYTCATFPDKNKNDSIKVTIEARVKPVITGLISQDVRQEDYKYVQLNCDTSGANPPAMLTWYKGSSKQAKERQKIKIFPASTDGLSGCESRTKGYYHLQNKKGTPLIICKPTHADHTGWYTCVAENIAGSDSKEAQINIFAAATIIDPLSSKQIQVSLGSPLNISCTATGNPVPDVVWTKSGSTEVLVTGKGTARLQFNRLQEDHLGNYTCNATNYRSSVLFLSIGEENPGVKAQTDGMSKQTLIGIICGCIAFVLLVSIICFIVYRRQKKQIEEYKEPYFLRTGNSDYKIDPDRSLLDQCNDLPYDMDWEFPEERLILGKPLGAGAFGQVVKAEAIGMAAFKPRDKTPEAVKNRSKLRRSMRESRKKNGYTSMRLTKTTVAVKTLKEGATQNDYKDLASELKILIHLGNHRNIVNILGACTRGRRLMVIIEFAPHGDLLSYLRGRRDIYEPNWVKTSNNPDQEFTLVDVAMGAYQISRGMEFLASRKCVHRDLAARNVLVGQDYIMKISDFGLARDIYKDDLYVKTTSGLLPVKWMAMESLFDRVYTEKSDVWSFGIVLWEIFTLGGNPYPGLPTEQLLDYLSEGQRMKQPQNCPLEMYALMRDCWMQFPEQRPEFAAVAERLGNILEKNVAEDNPYVHLQVDDQTGVTDYCLNPCDTFDTQRRQTADGYEEALPTPRPDTSNKYDTPLPTLPPPDSPGYDAPQEPLPPIPPTYEEATKKRSDNGARNSSQSSNESGIDIDEKEKLREETEPLIVRLADETRFSPGKKGTRSTESAV